MIIIFDLDQTLVNTDIAYNHRKQRNWDVVYSLIPQMNLYLGIDNIYQFLKSKGVRMALVSTSQNKYCKKVLTHFNLDFEVVVAYSDTLDHKPSPEPYLKALRLLQASNDCVYALGDDVKDIIAAKRAGIKSIGCGWGSYHPQALLDAKPDYYFSTPEELLKFLTANINSN